MKELAIYQLEVALCLTTFSALYLIFWRKETNFLFKRFLLISIPLLSMIIPLLDFNISMAKEQPILEYMVYIPNQIMTQSKEVLINSNEIVMQSDEINRTAPATISSWQVIVIAWILGAFIMLFRLGVSLWKIWKINQQAERSMDGKYKLVDDPIHSFSFFDLIVINKSLAGSKAKEHILAHELAHSQQGHSFDVVFFELIKIVQWFNPFIWLLTYVSKQNLEFLADQSATTSTKNKKGYQFAIVHHAANSGYQLLKTQFSKTNLKNRIIMMNQANNQKISAGKLLILLPLLGILFMSFSLKIENIDFKKELSEIIPLFNPESQNHEKSINFSSINKIDISGHGDVFIEETINDQDTLNNEVFTIFENPPRHATGRASYFEMLKEDLNYPAEAKAKNIKGKVFVEFTVQKDGTLRDVKAVKGIGYGCDEEAVRVISEGPTWIPGTQGGQAVDVRMIIPIGFGTDYPPKDMIGVRKISGTVKTENGDPVIGCNIIIKGTTIGTVTDLEGKFIIKVKPEHKELIVASKGLEEQIIDISEGLDYKIILTADSEYTGSDYPPLRGGKVLYGRPLTDSSGIDYRGIEPDNTRPLFIIDGKESYQYEMAEMNPNDIESISVLKNKDAIVKYGDKGLYGVILITTKEAKSKEPVYTDVTIIDDNNKDGLKLRTDGNLDFGQENPPIFFKDGVETTLEEVEKLDPQAIESIHVIKGKAAKEKYGKKGKDGVILINTKE